MHCRRCLQVVATLLVVVALFLGGADEGDCLPDLVNVVCAEDEHCLPGHMCNTLGECVRARVTIDTDAVWYAPGTPVVFTVDTHGLPIEVAQGGSEPAWTIEHWSTGERLWVPLRTSEPPGCRTTGCVGGRPIRLCAEPAPVRCVERCSPFDGVWDGYHWVTTEIPCGDSTVTLDERVAAPPGSYIVRYRYTVALHAGASGGGRCTPAETDTLRPFGIR